MSRRSLRHPFGGGNFYPKPASGRPAREHRSKARQPRIRPRRNVSVGRSSRRPRTSRRDRCSGCRSSASSSWSSSSSWCCGCGACRSSTASRTPAAVNANQIRTVSVDPPRGLIVDRHDTVLAGNTVEQRSSLSRAEATRAPDSDRQGRPPWSARPPAQSRPPWPTTQYSPYEPVPILQNAKPTTVQYLDTHTSEYPGVSVQQVTQRHYPQGGTLATHVLGYVGPITATLEGPPEPGLHTVDTGRQGRDRVPVRAVPAGRPRQAGARGRRAGDVVGTLKQTATDPGRHRRPQHHSRPPGRRPRTPWRPTWPADKKTRDPSTGKLPAATNGAAVVSSTPRPGPVLALASNPTYASTHGSAASRPRPTTSLSAGCQGPGPARSTTTPSRASTPRGPPSSWPPPPPPSQTG